ncbi:MAG: hypothetical protein HY922_11130 [Elusimicrobia bacterium]|nr:hypothetical protein [Elusimicrobiota bacterium]
MAKVAPIFQALIRGRDHATALQDLLSPDSVDEILLSTAFVRQDGINAIAKMLSRHAGKVTAYVGINNGSTSYQGICALLRTKVTVYVVDTKKRGQIFHPKFYLVRRGDIADVIVGSANLTHSGLHNNIEISARIALNLRQKSDKQFYGSIMSNIESLPHSFPTHCYPVLWDAHKLRKLLVDENAQNKADSSEAGPSSRPPQTGPGIPLPFVRPPARPKQRQAPHHRPPFLSRPHSPVASGPLVWVKPRLPQGDVQILRVGHTTGVLRLTQAEFRVGGTPIDHTTYFRKKVFSRLSWSTDPGDPDKETAEGLFQVVIQGRAVGLFKLKLSHKPKWEAAQRNYTTGLHWGDAASHIRKRGLIDKPLRLYDTPEGRNAVHYKNRLDRAETSPHEA